MKLFPLSRYSNFHFGVWKMDHFRFLLVTNLEKPLYLGAARCILTVNQSQTVFLRRNMHNFLWIDYVLNMTLVVFNSLKVPLESNCMETVYNGVFGVLRLTNNRFFVTFFVFSLFVSFPPNADLCPRWKNPVAAGSTN